MTPDHSVVVLVAGVDQPHTLPSTKGNVYGAWRCTSGVTHLELLAIPTWLSRSHTSLFLKSAAHLHS
jgi:hypothetical protein